MGTRRSYTALTARHGLVAASVLARLTGCCSKAWFEKNGKDDRKFDDPEIGACPRLADAMMGA